jgi:hypothetical protein
MNFLVQNVWVWAGTGLVLITLSGQTRKLGIIITLATIIIHSIASLFTKEKDQ